MTGSVRSVFALVSMQCFVALMRTFGFTTRINRPDSRERTDMIKAEHKPTVTVLGTGSKPLIRR